MAKGVIAPPLPDSQKVARALAVVRNGATSAVLLVSQATMGRAASFGAIGAVRTSDRMHRRDLAEMIARLAAPVRFPVRLRDLVLRHCMVARR